MSCLAAEWSVAVQRCDVGQEDIAAAAGGVDDVGMETVQGEQGKDRVTGPVPLVGEQGPDMLETLEFPHSSGLDGGLGLTDQTEAARLGASDAVRQKRAHCPWRPPQ
jgi:hypothetical protein